MHEIYEELANGKYQIDQEKGDIVMHLQTKNPQGKTISKTVALPLYSERSLRGEEAVEARLMIMSELIKKLNTRSG